MAERRQGAGASLAYALLAPLAVLAIVVWLPSEQRAQAIAVAFAVLSVLLLVLFPRDLDMSGYHWRRWFGSVLAALLVALLATVTPWLPLPALLIGLLCLWLLRLWYVRQYHRQQAQRAQRAYVELLRRCLLITLWSHISVVTALWSPYQLL